MRNVLLIAMACLLSAGVAWAGMPPDRRHYVGTKGDKPIVVTLQEKDVPGLRGSYREIAQGQVLWIDGKVSEQDRVEFTEENPANKFTGTLGEQGIFNGIWTSADGKQREDVRFQCIARTVWFFAGRSDRYTVSVGYPKFNSAAAFPQAVNKQLEKEAQEQLARTEKTYRDDTADPAAMGTAPWESITDAEALYSGEKLVSIYFLRYGYTGGAHGSAVGWGENWFWDGREARKLRWEHILKTDEATMTRLRELCIADLNRQNTGWPEQAKMDPLNPPAFNLTAGGLLITFPQYEVGPYSAGMPVVLLPYKDIAECLVPDGPAADLAK